MGDSTRLKILVMLAGSIAVAGGCQSSASESSDDGGADADTDVDTDVDTDTDSDTGTECVPEQYQQCGADGHVHWFDSCDVEGDIVEECPPENMLCVDTSETTAECQCLPSHSGPDCAEVCVRYVDLGAEPDGDGLAWASAFTELQDAIDSADAAAAADDEIAGCEVWVVAGTYYVYQSAREDTIQLESGALVFGGFTGSETSRGERDWRLNETVLDGRGEPEGDVRVYHVVTVPGDGVLDGFTVTAGSADSWSEDGNWAGGGMTIHGDGTPRIANSSFVENYANSGPGIGIGGSTHPVIEACSFVDNQSTGCGGSVSVDEQGHPTFVSCFFDENINEIESPVAGNGVIGLHDESRATVTSCTFTDDCCHVAGDWNYLLIANSVLMGEEPIHLGSPDPEPFITHTMLSGEFAEGDGNITPDSFTASFADPENGDYHLAPGSPCIDAADGEVAPPTDLDGNQRVDDPDTPNSGSGPPWADIGAFEYQP